MPTTVELIRVLLLPLLVSGVIAAIGRWRMWAAAMPLAAGVGFFVGCVAVRGVPRLPPSDGTDWLVWLAIPLTVLGMFDAWRGRGWGWLLGLAATGMALGVARPIVPAAVHYGVAIAVAAGLGLDGAAMALVARLARPRLGSWAVGIALAVTLGGAAVVVMSSNLRVVGVYGLAAAAATGPAAVLMPRKGRGVTVVAAGLLAGLLAGGRFYADPGVTWTNFTVLAAAPLLLFPAALLPARELWVRAVVGVVLVATAVGLVTVPTAVAAKHAAEDDPYGAGAE